MNTMLNTVHSIKICFYILEKYTLLGRRRDYWNFITEILPNDDGVKYVQMVPQVMEIKHRFCCEGTYIGTVLY